MLSRLCLCGYALLLWWAMPAGAADLESPALGRQLFIKGANPACAACHTLKDAGASGVVGPVLDELKPTAQRVANAVRQGVGLMPAYEGVLTEAQIQALAQYVVGATK